MKNLTQIDVEVEEKFGKYQSVSVQLTDSLGNVEYDKNLINGNEYTNLCAVKKCTYKYFKTTYPNINENIIIVFGEKNG